MEEHGYYHSDCVIPVLKNMCLIKPSDWMPNLHFDVALGITFKLIFFKIFVY